MQQLVVTTHTDGITFERQCDGRRSKGHVRWHGAARSARAGERERARRLALPHTCLQAHSGTLNSDKMLSLRGNGT